MKLPIKQLSGAFLLLAASHSAHAINYISSPSDPALSNYPFVAFKGLSVSVDANQVAFTVTVAGGLDQPIAYDNPSNNPNLLDFALGTWFDVDGDGYMSSGDIGIYLDHAVNNSAGTKSATVGNFASSYIWVVSNCESGCRSTAIVDASGSGPFKFQPNLTANTLSVSIPKSSVPGNTLSVISPTTKYVHYAYYRDATNNVSLGGLWPRTQPTSPSTPTPTPTPSPQPANYGPPYRVTFTDYCDVYEMNHVTPGSTVLYGRNVASGCESDAFIAGEIVAGTNPLQVVLTGGYASSGPADAVKVISLSANNGYGGSFSAYGAKKGAARNGVEVTKSVSGNWSLAPISGGAGGSFSSSEKMPSLKSVLGQ